MLDSFFSKFQRCDRNERDFSLHSGERQTGTSLADIRYDHRARYSYIADYLSSSGTIRENAFGLDIFCANGYGAYLVSETLNCVLLGVDASMEAIACANSHYSNGRTFFAHKAFPFQLPKAAFNFVICLESLEHVVDASDLLREISESVRPGGYLFLSTPNERLFSLAKNPDKFHCRHYTMPELLALVEEVTDLELLNWAGQNLYKMDDGIISCVLPDDLMHLKEREEGQLLFFVFRTITGVR